MIQIQRDIIASEGRATPEQLDVIQQAVATAGGSGRTDILDSASQIQEMIAGASGGFDDTSSDTWCQTSDWAKTPTVAVNLEPFGKPSIVEHAND